MSSFSSFSTQQLFELFELFWMNPLIIPYLQTCELAQGSIALVCRSWLQTHREHAWQFMVLTAGTAEDLHDDLDMSEAHASVKTFLSAPCEVRERAARSAQSLTLKIAQLEEFLDHYERWVTLPFDRLKRLVIDGPDFGRHCRGLALRHALDGLRLGLVLSKVAHTVETLIVRPSFAVEHDDPAKVADTVEQNESDSIVTAIVSTFPKLVGLGLPSAGYGLGLSSPPAVAHWAFLESCQGFLLHIYDCKESWLASAPRLKRLHLNICLSSKHDHRSVLDCSPFFSFLADKCPLLEYLELVFCDYDVICCQAFTCIPTRMKWLVLSFDGTEIEGLEADRSETGNESEAESREAERMCNHLRPWVPNYCKLFVFKGLRRTDLEDSIRCIMNTEYAACA